MLFFFNDRHVLTVLPSQRTIQALDATLYDEIDTNLKMLTISFKGIDDPERMRSQIRGIRRLISRPDNTKLEVGVGTGGSFSVSLYQYSDEGRPIKVREFSNGWGGEAEWQYH